LPRTDGVSLDPFWPGFGADASSAGRVASKIRTIAAAITATARRAQLAVACDLSAGPPLFPCVQVGFGLLGDHLEDLHQLRHAGLLPEHGSALRRERAGRSTDGCP
jgi:hypothetical protein